MSFRRTFATLVLTSLAFASVTSRAGAQDVITNFHPDLRVPSKRRSWAISRHSEENL